MNSEEKSFEEKSLPQEINNIVLEHLNLKERCLLEIANNSNFTDIGRVGEVVLENGIAIRSNAYGAFYISSRLKKQDTLARELYYFESERLEHQPDFLTQLLPGGFSYSLAEFCPNPIPEWIDGICPSWEVIIERDEEMPNLRIKLFYGIYYDKKQVSEFTFDSTSTATAGGGALEGGLHYSKKHLSGKWLSRKIKFEGGLTSNKTFIDFISILCAGSEGLWFKYGDRKIYWSKYLNGDW